MFWHADYRLPIEAFHEKMKEVITRARRVVVLQVTEANGQTVELRGLMSARTSPRAWDLRCEVREKMIVWLQESHPQALPRIRADGGRGPRRSAAGRGPDE